MIDNIYKEITKAMEKREKIVLITIINTEGSVPNKVGAKMLVWPDGKIAGTVGGGSPEAIAIKEGLKIFEKPEAKTVTFDLTPGQEHSVGPICGGKLTIYMEPINFLKKLVIFGGGHVGYEVYKLGKAVDFDVTVVDDRPDFANTERFPMADRVICKPFVESINDIGFDSDTYAVILTKGHVHDEIVLRGILNLDVNIAYTGMIGSMKKVKILLDNMASEGIKKEKIDRVYSPIGLKIGGNSPAEIGISIMAEILKVKYGTTGVSMRDA